MLRAREIPTLWTPSRLNAYFGKNYGGLVCRLISRSSNSDRFSRIELRTGIFFWNSQTNVCLIHFCRTWTCCTLINYLIARNERENGTISFRDEFKLKWDQSLCLEFFFFGFEKLWSSNLKFGNVWRLINLNVSTLELPTMRASNFHLSRKK